jgi:NADH:ubiquinone oxidoreductase subunit 3 (subunit A)
MPCLWLQLCGKAAAFENEEPKVFRQELNFCINFAYYFNFMFVVFNFKLIFINKLHYSRQSSGFQANPPLTT